MFPWIVLVRDWLDAWSKDATEARNTHRVLLHAFVNERGLV